MKRLKEWLPALILLSWCSAVVVGAAFDAIDLEKRGEQTSALTATQHDANLTKIEAAVNALSSFAKGAEAYGEAYWTDNAVVTSIGIASTWYKVIGTLNPGHLEGPSIITSTNQLLLPAGDWIVQAHASFSGGSVSDVVQVALGVSNAHDGTHVQERKLQTSDTQSISLGGVVVCTSSSPLDLRVQNLTGSRNLTFKHLTFVAHRKH